MDEVRGILRNLRRMQLRWLPAAAIGSAWRGVVFTWSGVLGLVMLAIGCSIYYWSGLPLLIIGALIVGAVAGNSYGHVMTHLRPSLTATDEDREVAKLKFEAELRKNYVRGGQPSILAMFAINQASQEAQDIGVPVDALQEIANRLYAAQQEGGGDAPAGG